MLSCLYGLRHTLGKLGVSPRLRSSCRISAIVRTARRSRTAPGKSELSEFASCRTHGIGGAAEPGRWRSEPRAAVQRVPGASALLSYCGQREPPTSARRARGCGGGVEGGVPTAAGRARCPRSRRCRAGSNPLLRERLGRDSAAAGRAGVGGGQRRRERPGLGEEGPAAAGGGAGGHTSLSPSACLRGAEDGGAGGPATAAVVAVRRDGTGPDSERVRPS